MIDFKRYPWEYDIDSRNYRPIDDSISVQTWRKEDIYEVFDRRKMHKYPIRGTYGEPVQHPDAEDRTDIP